MWQTFEDVENNKQSEVAACVVHRARLSDLHVIKLLFVLTGVNPWTRLADFHLADKNAFRLTMRNFCRLRVERGLTQPIERIQPENEKLIAELAESFWLAR